MILKYVGIWSLVHKHKSHKVMPHTHSCMYVYQSLVPAVLLYYPGVQCTILRGRGTLTRVAPEKFSRVDMVDSGASGTFIIY
jgi:hypothetical protein